MEFILTYQNYGKILLKGDCNMKKTVAKCTNCEFCWYDVKENENRCRDRGNIPVDVMPSDCYHRIYASKQACEDDLRSF